MAKSKSKADQRSGEAKKPTERQGAYFLSLSLENVRCFGPKQTLDLSDGNGKPARWTIILGVNGTGKTTILQSFVGFERIPIPLTTPQETRFRFYSFPEGVKESFQRRGHFKPTW